METILERVNIGFDLRDPLASVAVCSQLVEKQQLLFDSFRSIISVDLNVLRRRQDIDQIFNDNIEVLGNPLGLANSLEVLMEQCKAKGASVVGQVPLCITSSKANLIALNERFGFGWFESAQTENHLISSGWVACGFDVIDFRGLISGLSGCGYKDKIRKILQGYFGHGINEFGLFNSYSLAQQFAEVRGLEIPTHSPQIAVGVLIRP